MWETVETKAGKTRMAEVERRGEKKEAGKKREKKTEKQKKQKKERMIDVKRVAEEWEIWDEEEEAAKSEAETKKLVLEKFYKWIKVFSKKQSEQMPTRKI